MMTKDKAGNPVFQKGRSYKAREWFSPIWPPGHSSRCLDTRGFVTQDGRTIADGSGQFTVGDDTRWWAASSQFEEAT